MLNLPPLIAVDVNGVSGVAGVAETTSINELPPLILSGHAGAGASNHVTKVETRALTGVITAVEDNHFYINVILNGNVNTISKWVVNHNFARYARYSNGRQALPVEQHDIIRVTGEIETYNGEHCAIVGSLRMSQRPAVRLPTDRIALRHYCYKAFRSCGNVERGLVERFIAALFQDDAKTIEFLDKLSCLEFVPDDHYQLLQPLSKRHAKDLVKWWKTHRVIRSLEILGIIPEYYDMYDGPLNEMYQLAISNPYRLYQIPMTAAQEIVAVYGLQIVDAAEEYRAGVIGRDIASHFYRSDKKWSSIPMDWVNKYIERLAVDDSCRDRLVVKIGHGAMYDPVRYSIESEVVSMLREVLLKSTSPYKYTPPTSGLQPSPDQIIAIQNILSSSCSALSGAAGTGKTTVLREVVRTLMVYGRRCILAGPTGTAVSQMKKTGLDKLSRNEDDIVIGTIHLLLTKRPLLERIEYIIFDESSMITVPLLCCFLRYIKAMLKYMPTLVFVGDCNQLEPLRWGAIFYQLMNSNRVIKSLLTTNHRSCKAILQNAEAVLYDRPYTESTEVINGKMQGFSLTDKDVLYLYGIFARVSSDVRIITPYNLEVVRLNKEVQKLRNGNAGSVYLEDGAGNHWYKGDLVMMASNSYKIKHYRGDCGVVEEISGRQMKVKFYDATVHVFAVSDSKYQITDEDENEDDVIITTLSLKLAYALTVDSAQGSESDIVLIHIPPHKANPFFITRNRLYTAITRGKSLVIGTGHKDSFDSAKRNVTAPRHDLTSMRIDQENDT